MAENKLVRGLGRWDLTAIAINLVIGTGIFILPAEVAGLIGSFSIFAFILCAVIVGLIVLCFAEVSSRFNATGGMYLYAKEAFGPVVGFEVGWLYWVVRVATFAANCNALLIYLGFFFPNVGEGWPRIAVITFVVGLITLVNLLGIRESAIMTNLFTVGKLVPLLLFVAIGMFFVQPANFNFAPALEYDKFTFAILPLIYAFVGFEAAVIPAGETKDPKKNLPFALLTALAIVTVLFILIQIVAIGTLPGLAESKRPLADAAAQFIGPFGATFIAFGALISILGNLNGGFLASSRLPFAMAEQQDLPAILAKTHSKFRTPYVSILITSIVILILTIQTSFYKAVAIAVITRLLVYATTCIALPVFRRRKDAPAAEFKAPFGVLAAFVSLALIVWLLLQVKFEEQAIPVLIVSAVGILIYLANRYLGARKVEVD